MRGAGEGRILAAASKGRLLSSCADQKVNVADRRMSYFLVELKKKTVLRTVVLSCLP